MYQLTSTKGFYGVWRDGQLIAAAGVHFVTPFIAQIGNVFSHPRFRERGYATAATAGVTNHLRRMGIQIISLFVVAENAPAIRIYQRQGFVKERELIYAHNVSTGSLRNETFSAVSPNH